MKQDENDLLRGGNLPDDPADGLGNCSPNSGGGDGPVVVRLSDVQPKPVRWLWRGRIPLGKLTVIDGDPGVSKSLFTVDLAARVSKGAPMPDGTRGDLSGPAGVVMLSAEDDPEDTVRPRLDAAQGDPGRVAMLNGVRYSQEDRSGRMQKRERFVTLQDVSVIETAVTETAAQLVVVDPVMAYLGGKTNGHVDAEIRAVLSPLAKLAAETGAAIVVVRHLRKQGTSNPVYAGGGSIGIIGAARMGLMVVMDPDDPAPPQSRRRIVAPTKSNLAGLPDSLAYVVETVDVLGVGNVPRISWQGAAPHTAADLMARVLEGGRAERRDQGKSKKDAAADWLEAELARAGGSRRVKDIKSDAKAAGVAWRTLERAADERGILRRRNGWEAEEGWSWVLPGAQGDQGVLGQGGRLDSKEVGGVGDSYKPEASGGNSAQGRQAGPLAALADTAAFGHLGSIPPKRAKIDSPEVGCLFPSHKSKWQSTAGNVACGVCHPPASNQIVAAWIEGEQS